MPNVSFVAAADINGDGRSDLVATAENAGDPSADGVVSVFLSQGATFANPETFATGAQPVSIAIGDFNGDGHPDLVVANEGSNTVSVLLAQCK
jgi:hypothetical protein